MEEEDKEDVGEAGNGASGGYIPAMSKLSVRGLVVWKISGWSAAGV